VLLFYTLTTGGTIFGGYSRDAKANCINFIYIIYTLDFKKEKINSGIRKNFGDILEAYDFFQILIKSR